MPPNIRYGLGSSRLAKPWICICGRANWPTRHVIFSLPKDRCDCGIQVINFLHTDDQLDIVFHVTLFIILVLK